MSYSEINRLREAVNLSPNNIPLRMHLAGVYVDCQHWEEAELEFKTILSLDSNNMEAQLGLVNSFLQQMKTIHGLVVVENILHEHRRSAPAKAHFLYAQLLLEDNKAADAKVAYDQALEIDEDLLDMMMELRFNETLGTPIRNKMPKDEETDQRKKDPRGSDKPDIIDDHLNVKVIVESSQLFTIEVYNQQNKKMLTIIKDKFLNPGSHTFRLDATNLTNGVYQLIIQTNGQKVTKTVIVKKHT